MILDLSKKIPFNLLLQAGGEADLVDATLLDLRDPADRQAALNHLAALMEQAVAS